MGMGGEAARPTESGCESISLRPITEDDRDFLLQVYSSTRQDELALVDWDDSQKEAFLQMQFAAQHRYYSENYLGATFELILDGQQPIGRLYVHRRADEIRVIDIALLPEHRNRGIGRRLMLEVLSEGQARGVPVTIHVECFNPAKRFYTRLGFEGIETHGVYELMKWTPESVLSGTAAVHASGF